MLVLELAGGKPNSKPPGWLNLTSGRKRSRDVSITQQSVLTALLPGEIGENPLLNR